MTNEDIQQLGKSSVGVALNSFGVWAKATQAFAVEVVDYSKKSAESSIAAWEELLAAKSFEKAVEVQNEYLRSSYEDFVTEVTKLGELYADVAKEAYKSFEGAKTSAGK